MTTEVDLIVQEVLRLSRVREKHLWATTIAGILFALSIMLLLAAVLNEQAAEDLRYVTPVLTWLVMPFATLLLLFGTSAGALKRTVERLLLGRPQARKLLAVLTASSRYEYLEQSVNPSPPT